METGPGYFQLSFDLKKLICVRIMYGIFSHTAYCTLTYLYLNIQGLENCIKEEKIGKLSFKAC